MDSVNSAEQNYGKEKIQNTTLYSDCEFRELGSC